jgi:hypothetical protein
MFHPKFSKKKTFQDGGHFQNGSQQKKLEDKIIKVILNKLFLQSIR